MQWIELRRRVALQFGLNGLFLGERPEAVAIAANGSSGAQPMAGVPQPLAAGPQPIIVDVRICKFARGAALRFSNGRLLCTRERDRKFRLSTGAAPPAAGDAHRSARCH
jgi:hypothetical protein